MAFVYQNKNLFTFCGIIGRANFLINYLLLAIISSVCTAPLIIASFLNGTLFSADILVMISKAPVLAVILYIALFPLGLYLNFANVSKRIADIRGKGNTPSSYAIIFIAIILFTFSASFEAFTLHTTLISYLSIFAFIALASIKGKITSQDYDADMAKFNWGAFWGTWIWGINNKVSQTYWAIPAFFMGAFPFAAIIFGIKGNEWAYKNRDWDSMEEFHDSQSNQAMIWTIAAPAVWVVMSIVISFIIAITIGMYTATQEGSEQLQSFNDKLKEKAEKIMDTSISSIFSNYKVEDDVYKFYINPKKWVAYDEKSKMQILNTAADYVITKKLDPDAEYTGDEGTSSERQMKFTVLQKTKIYSNFNNELLAEFEFNEEEMISRYSGQINMKNIGEMIKEMQKCYKFNDYPTVP